MASSSKGSKLLPVAVLLIIIALLAGGYYFTQVGISDGKGGRQVLDFKTGRLKTVTIDADLASDTLNTIAIDSADIKDKFKGIEEANFEQQRQMREMAETLRQLNDTNRALKSQLEQQNRKMASVEDAVSSSPTIDADSIKASILGVLKKNLPELMPDSQTTADKATSDEYSITDQKDQPEVETRTRLRSYGLPINEKGQISPLYLKHLDQTNTESLRQENRDEPLITNQQTRTVDPRFTIPTDAALFDSVTITALVGRIPRDGDVNDPSPFKVAIGRDNLVANGFSLPGIDGMIMSGVVYGDAVRKCVRTKITRATYIFEDGRILTLPKKRKAKVIGYLADPQGDPCIKGRYITNGNAQLTKSILANMAAGAANAFAETQTTSQTNSLGGTTKSVTGNNKKFVIGSAISSGANSVATLLNNQQFDQWDQVVVDVGKTVTIHIDEQLEIDNASDLRKISYENENSYFGLTD